MRNIKVAEFLKRMARECPGAKLNWISVLEQDWSNVIDAEIVLEELGCISCNLEGQRRYGKYRLFSGIPRYEWVHRLSFSRKITRSSIQLGTFV